MAQLALRFVPEAISNRKEFQGNSLSARWEGEDYVVRSYATAIAIAKANGHYWITSDKYSVTTSKHTNYVRRGFASSGAPVSWEEIRGKA